MKKNFSKKRKENSTYSNLRGELSPGFQVGTFRRFLVSPRSTASSNEVNYRTFLASLISVCSLFYVLTTLLE